MRPSNNLENKALSDTYWRFNMYESLGSQFFTTTTGIQSGLDAFDESRFVMTFLTTLRVMEILCSFWLVLEGKIGKEIPESLRLEFLEKFLANNFALLDAEGNTSGPLNRGGIADLPLLRTLLAICQNSFVFVIITSLSELYFRFRRFVLLTQTKKVISMNYGSSTSC